MSTKIEWVKNEDGTQGRSWNPITGCTKVSPGCKNCYAERMARRLAGRCGYPKAPHHFDVVLRPERLEEPLRRKKPTTYFVCSMSDLFHKDVRPEFAHQVFEVMEKASQHTFQILTKQSDRMEWFIDTYSQWRDWPLPNVWLGVSIESPEYSYRATILAEIPAAVRFISFEPLLASFADCPGVLDNIDWAIVGGESGPGARPMHPDWVRDIRDQCVAADASFFFKQYGEWIAHDIWHQAGKPRYTKWGCMNIEGAYFDQTTTWNGIQYPPQDGREVSMYQVGKKRAGRALDGREWNQMPINKKGIEQ